jgi:hypothetical protein
VETATTQPDAGLRFHYDKIVRAGQAQVVGTLGHNNFGYVMPDPRVAEQVADGGHLPICQQCHEDVRSVGNAIPQTVDPSENFVISGAGDGDVPTDNPRYQTFPHESQNQFFLVEAADSLCLNCHDPANLP